MTRASVPCCLLDCISLPYAIQFFLFDSTFLVYIVHFSASSSHKCLVFSKTLYKFTLYYAYTHLGLP